MPLYKLLYWTKYAHATGPRDKVFTFVRLPTSPTTPQCSPDYHLGVKAVCKRTVLHHVEAEKNLHPLLRRSEKTISLPSWLPDSTAMNSYFDPEPLLNPFSQASFAASG